MYSLFVGHTAYYMILYGIKQIMRKTNKNRMKQSENMIKRIKILSRSPGPLVPTAGRGPLVKKREV